MMNRVDCGCSWRSTRSSSWPSTLLTKWKRLPLWQYGSSASTAMRGPRSDPPMPICTTSVICAWARTDSANARKSVRTASTSCQRPRKDSGTLAASGQRNSQCITARCSVLLIGSPRNMASRSASTWRCSASCISSRTTWRSACTLEASTCSKRLPSRACRVWLKVCRRWASWAKAWRRSKAPSATAASQPCSWLTGKRRDSASSASQAGAWLARPQALPQPAGASAALMQPASTVPA